MDDPYYGVSYLILIISVWKFMDAFEKAYPSAPTTRMLLYSLAIIASMIMLFSKISRYNTSSSE